MPTAEKERTEVTAQSVAKNFGLPDDLVGRKFIFTSKHDGLLDMTPPKKVSVTEELPGTITGMRLVCERDKLYDSYVHVTFVLDTDRIEKGFPVTLRAYFRADNPGRIPHWNRVIQMGFQKGGAHDVDIDTIIHTFDHTIEDTRSGELKILDR